MPRTKNFISTTFQYSNMFKKLAKAAKTVGKKFAPLAVAGGLLASVSAQKNWELNICPSYTHYFQNPAQSYCEQLNEDFRSGRYTAKAPIPEWEDLKFEQGPTFGINASLLFGENVKMGPTFGYNKSKIICNDYQEHWFWSNALKDYVKLTFDREEQTEIETKSLGWIIKFLWENVALSLAGYVDLHDVNGNVDYEMRRPDTEYIQWREANYFGSGTGFSGELGFDYYLNKNFSINVTGGMRTGEIKTRGRYKIKSTTNPWWRKAKKDNYNPIFKFKKAPYIKISLNRRF
jgi:hypothetical protein